MEKNKKCKVVKFRDKEIVESLLIQLEELTDRNSIHFDESVFGEKEAIKKKILSGDITIV